MNFVNSLNINDIDAKEIPCIKGNGAPTTATEGAVGCLYMDTASGDIYKCTAVASGAHTWVLINSAEVVQTTGDSETAVMSQDSVTKELQKITTDKSGANKYLPITEGFVEKALIQEDGSVRVRDVYDDYVVTPLIPVEPDTVYTHTFLLLDRQWDALTTANKLYTYDAYGSPLRTVELVSNDYKSVTFTTPSTAAYIRIGMTREKVLAWGASIETVIVAFNSKFMLVYGTDYPSEFVPYGITEKSVIREKVEEIIEEKGLENTLPFANATIVNFGDSIFGNYRAPNDISTFLAEITGATVHNCGFGGCQMGKHWTDNYDAFGMAKLADAIASGDFSLQDAAIADTSASATLPAYFADTLALLKSIDFNNVDIITIAYGTNDLGSGYGVDGENINSFGGALRHSVETILTAFPQIRIFICSPIWRFWMDDAGEFVEDSDTKVIGNDKLTDIVNKAKEIANEYHLPFIDNYYELGLNKFNRTVYFPATDGTHPNNTGRELIAKHIAQKLF